MLQSWDRISSSSGKPQFCILRHFNWVHEAHLCSESKWLLWRTHQRCSWTTFAKDMQVYDTWIQSTVSAATSSRDAVIQERRVEGSWGLGPSELHRRLTSFKSFVPPEMLPSWTGRHREWTKGWKHDSEDSAVDAKTRAERGPLGDEGLAATPAGPEQRQLAPAQRSKIRLIGTLMTNVKCPSRFMEEA